MERVDQEPDTAINRHGSARRAPDFYGDGDFTTTFIRMEGCPTLDITTLIDRRQSVAPPPGGSIDARQKKRCDNAKAANITIYIGAGEHRGGRTSGVLQHRASSADKFYLITPASQTVSVFNDIGTSLSELRVAR